MDIRVVLSHHCMFHVIINQFYMKVGSNDLLLCNAACSKANRIKLCKVDEKAMMRNRYNLIPYPAPGTNRERNTNN